MMIRYTHGRGEGKTLYFSGYSTVQYTLVVLQKILRWYCTTLHVH